MRRVEPARQRRLGGAEDLGRILQQQQHENTVHREEVLLTERRRHGERRHRLLGRLVDHTEQICPTPFCVEGPLRAGTGPPTAAELRAQMRP